MFTLLLKNLHSANDPFRSLTMTFLVSISFAATVYAKPVEQTVRTKPIMLEPSQANWANLIRQAHSEQVQGLFRSAEQKFDKAIALLPEDHDLRVREAPAILGRAECREALSKFEKAAQDVRQYLDLNPSGRWGFGSCCRILAEAGLYKEAITHLHEYILSTSNHAAPYALLALCTASAHLDERAVADLGEAISLHFGKQDMEWKHGPFCSTTTMAMLQQQYESQIKREPKNAHSHLERGLLETLNQNYASAIKELSTCVNLDPKLWEALNVRANCFLYTGDLKAALSDIDHAIELAPKDPSNYKTLARYYNSKDTFDQLLEDLDHRIAKDPQNETLWLAKANAYEQLRDTTKAVESYTRAIAIYPHCADALNGRGLLYQELVKNSDAIADFSAAIKLQPSKPQFYRDRATCYFSMHKDKETIADLSRVIDLTHDPYAYGARAECYTRLGKSDLAAQDKKVTYQNVPHG